MEICSQNKKRYVGISFLNLINHLYTLEVRTNYRIIQQNNLLILGAKPDYSVIVIPNYFALHETLMYAVQRLHQRTNLPVVLKNVDPRDFWNLCDLGFRPYEKEERWCESARFDDQTFPQRIIDIEHLITARGSGYQKLRQRLNKFLFEFPLGHEDCWWTNPYLLLREEEFKVGEADELVQQFMAEQSIRIPGFYEAHKIFLDVVKSKDIYRWKILHDKEIVGFFFCDAISDVCAANAAMIYSYLFS